jgi:hypothetical protein
MFGAPGIPLIPHQGEGMRKIWTLAIAAAMTALLAACLSDAKDDGTPDDGGEDTLPVDSASPFAKFDSTVSVSLEGATLVVESNGVPNHKSPYFATTDARYEAYNGTGTFAKNPNSIATQTLTFRIPAAPAPATTHQSTSGGPIGVAVNGVALFNQYAAGNSPLTNEIASFDQYNGHPQMQGQYHYHIEPLYLTARNGKSSLIGWLLDGYPVYGPQENNAAVNETSLDVYHGHSHATAEYPNGTYHYHITASSPYINGGQYYGTPGTVTQ